MNRSLSSRSSRCLKLLRAACPLFAAGLISLGCSGVRAANYYWDPAQTNTDPGSGGMGNWDTTSTFWKLAGTSGDVVWPNTTANTADFAGTAGTVTLTAATINAQGLIFDTAGYTVATGANTLNIGTSGIVTNNVTGTTTLTGTVASVGSQTWTVAAGGTLQFNAGFSSATATNTFQLNSNGTTNITGTFTVSGKSTLSGTGIFNLTGTESFETSAGDYSGIAGATVNNTAGSATFSGGTANSFFLGNTGTTQASALNVTGGTVNIGNTRIFIGDSFNGTVTTAGDGTLTIGGGAGVATVNTGTSTLTAALGNNVATGTININANGVLASNHPWTAGTAAKGVINFNGGTLQALGTGLGITNGITTNIADNGGTIDPNGFAITLATNFTHGGTAATDGGLKIASSSTGTVALTGVLSQTGGLTFTTGGSIAGNNTYTGPTVINAFVDGSANGTILGATGAGNGTTIGTGGTLRFRDSSNKTIGEALTFNGGTFLTYNDPGTTTLSGAITLNANTTLTVSPQAQASTTLVVSGGIADGATTGNSLVLNRLGAAAAASNDVLNITGASTYGGATAITDSLNTNTGNFSVRLSGGDNRLPVGTTLTLGGTAGGGVAAGSGRLILGDPTAGVSNQTIAGLVTSGTGTRNAVVGGATTVSTLTLNIATGTTNTYAGLLGGTATNENNLALAKTGAGTVALGGANTYSGGTTVTTGMLTASVNSALGTGNVSIANGATLTLATGVTNGIADTANLSLGATATLALNGTMGTSQETVNGLIVNGVARAAGTYGAIGDTAANFQLSEITGAGELTVLTLATVPEPSTWAMLIAGCGGLATLVWRRRQRA